MADQETDRATSFLEAYAQGIDLQAAGDLAGADAAFRRALAIQEAASGAPTDLTRSLNGLAGLLRLTGSCSEAEALYRRALELPESDVGPEHPIRADSLNGLGHLYWTLGRLRDAEPLVRHALVIRERTLGADHEKTAESLNTIGLLLSTQARYAEALLLRYRAARASVRSGARRRP